jgi:hypothetical protein
VTTSGDYKVWVANKTTGCSIISETVNVDVRNAPDVPEVKVKDNVFEFCQGLQTTLYTPMKNVVYHWQRLTIHNLRPTTILFLLPKQAIIT